MNITWAVGLQTIHHISEKIIGATVMGGDIVSIDRNGNMELVWENTENDGVISPYLYSVFYDNRIFFLPDRAESVLVLSINGMKIQKYTIIGKEEDEVLYPIKFRGEFLVVGISTGRIWKFNNEKFELIHGAEKRIRKLDKWKNVAEERYVSFIDTEGTCNAVYDCQENMWIYYTSPEPLIDGFCDDKYLWGVSIDHIYRIPIEGEDNEERIEQVIEKADAWNTIIPMPDSKVAVFPDMHDFYYLFDKKNLSWERIGCKQFNKEFKLVAERISDEEILLTQLEKPDWMIEKQTKYYVYDSEIKSMEIFPLLHVGEICQKKFEKIYSESLWKSAPQKILIEDKRHDLEFLIHSFDLNVFE